MALYVALALSLVVRSIAVASSHLRHHTTTFTSTGNPLLADGSIYSADPAPLVINETVYILSGRDNAGATENNFIMNEWQIFEAQSPDASGGYSLRQKRVQLTQVKSSRAPTENTTLYAPVTQANSATSDPFAIGVAVSSNVLGPFTDAHYSGPIVSQSVPFPGDTIQNIDPTFLVDTDGRVFIYFGTFGQLRGYELAPDMVTIQGSVTTVTSLTGYVEAPWLMKRGTTYYLLLWDRTSPLGSWTFRGIVLDIVSSKTSHPGVYQLGGEWFITYHTRDAVGGTHFRRSIAFDKLEWDDTTSPPSILKMKQTHRPAPAQTPTRNIAPRATPSSTNITPIQYWINAINDGCVEANPLPPDYWCSYAAEESPQTSTLTYKWNTMVQLNGATMALFADQPVGSNIGVPPPASWKMEYLTSAGLWTAVSVTSSGGYLTTVTDSPKEVSFQTVSTTSLRAILTASGSQYGGVGVKEWAALAPAAQ
ncbi:glycosyl hydrolase family 43 protein [Hyaloscypha finlandica]|nr:glycosyl hydrolase family 43 protein [Hyaloscypha finlandica]